MAAGAQPPAPPKRRLLYGRSRGKPLRPSQERLLAEALPRLEIAPDALAAGAALPFQPSEIWLEIGFGAGEHLIGEARA
ncbi:MAG TPA: tRNA (guanosine(46)-N7)-methyltransferase TrmB, partial [Roseiarcus sp.]|nr:tRNA (guanosine(46)-N7)-methyltransferase TrmB [Roseiarcus sp.]